jgi:hypothetical protein
MLNVSFHLLVRRMSVMWNVIMLSVVTLSVVMLSVTILSAIMLSIMAPICTIGASPHNEEYYHDALLFGETTNLLFFHYFSVLHSGHNCPLVQHNKLPKNVYIHREKSWTV